MSRIYIQSNLEDFGPSSVPVAAYGDEPVIDGDAVVIPDNAIDIEFDYPLSRPAVRHFESPNGHGFTRNDLYKAIYDGYSAIYAEEDAATSIPAEPIGATAGGGYLINRKKTNGPHGIWGHVIEDLFIEWVDYDPGKRLVTLRIGS